MSARLIMVQGTASHAGKERAGGGAVPYFCAARGAAWRRSRRRIWR